MLSLSENTKWTNIKAAESTATTGSTSSAIDMAGFDSVLFVRKAGAARTFTIEGTDTGATATDFAALTGAAVTTTATGQTAIIEVVKPTQRYLRMVVGAGVTAVYSECFAVQWDARNAPITNALAATDGFKVAKAVTPSV
jgi:hypothetical protein